jgi:hypothetical protein
VCCCLASPNGQHHCRVSLSAVLRLLGTASLHTPTEKADYRFRLPLPKQSTTAQAHSTADYCSDILYSRLLLRHTLQPTNAQAHSSKADYRSGTLYRDSRLPLRHTLQPTTAQAHSTADYLPVGNRRMCPFALASSQHFSHRRLGIWKVGSCDIPTMTGIYQSWLVYNKWYIPILVI